MKRFIILTGILLLFTAKALLQTPMNRDSLEQLLRISPKDTNRVLLLINTGQQYEGSDPEKAKQYYNEAGELSKKLDYRLGTLKYISNYGYVLNMQGRFDSSLVLNLESVRLAREWGDSIALAKCLFNTGTSYQLLDRYEPAVETYLEGRAIFSQQNNEIFTAKADDILQTLYQKLRRYDKALELGEEAIQLSRKHQLDYELSNALANMAINYNQVNEPQKAIPLLTEALQLSKTTGNAYLEESVQLSFADTREKLKQFSLMKAPAEAARSLAREMEDPKGEAIALRQLSVWFFYTGDLKMANNYAKQSYDINSKNNFRDEVQKNLIWLSDLSLTMGNKAGYTSYREKGNLLADSLLNEQIHNRITELEEKYETELKETKINMLESKNLQQEMKLVRKTTFNALLIGLVAVLFLTAVLLFRNFKQKQILQLRRINELEKEKQLLATEAVLKGEEQERARLAKDLHDGLGGLLSGIKFSFQKMKTNLVLTSDNQQVFERSLDMLDSSIKEMRRVAHNMMPEALVKYGLDTALKDFCNDINQTGALEVTYQSVGLADAEIGQTKAISLYRIVQELISNTLKHAGAGSAIIQLIKNDDTLSLTVEDDGRGFDTTILKKANGIGWDNIKSRVEFLQGKLDLQSSAGKGTSVHIDFNLV
ncbi:MAG: tetratricopeptide repeat protein [Terrimonas sp.]|nr:tetratricopeptide repeat protein [Terrimonas sp.]